MPAFWKRLKENPECSIGKTKTIAMFVTDITKPSFFKLKVRQSFFVLFYLFVLVDFLKKAVQGPKQNWREGTDILPCPRLSRMRLLPVIHSPPEWGVCVSWWTTLTHRHPECVGYIGVPSRYGASGVWTNVWQVSPTRASCRVSLLP